MNEGFVEAYAKSTGVKQLVPEHWLDHPVLGADFALTPSAQARADEQPEGNPSTAWTRKQLDAHAATLGIDTTGLPSKAAAFDAITDAPAVADPDTSPVGTGTSEDDASNSDAPIPDGTESSDESPAAGENQE